MSPDRAGESWLEASARARLDLLLDPGSFSEWVGPEQRVMSPHLERFDLPCAFDDGVVVGRGRLDGGMVFVAAQEGRFMGGTFGEVSGAKINGLLRATACATPRPQAVLLLLDTGGVRLQEANAGEMAVSEIIRAIAETRRAGVAVIALVGGKAGAFGGGGIITACCSRIIISQHGRTSVSGPEVIETNKGVEEFDSKDRGLVWRVTGGRSRVLIGGADRYVRDTIAAFREAAIDLVASSTGRFDVATLRAEQQRLASRLDQDGDSRDATDIWARSGINDPGQVPELGEDQFIALLAERRPQDDAR